MEAPFDLRIAADGIQFKYALGPSIWEGTEVHPYHEIIYLLGGDTELVFDQDRQILPVGALVLIPCACYHQMLLRDQRCYRRDLLHFPREILQEHPLADVKNLFTGGVRILSTPSSHIRTLFAHLNEFSEKAPAQPLKALFLQGVLYQLLVELSLSEADFTAFPHFDGSLGHRIACYIDAHLGETLSLAELSRIFCVSPSLLSHAFRKEMDTSVYRYLTQKRLVRAHNLLAEGMRAADVASRCGYTDYSAFFRAYRKFFGIAPSQF